MLRHRLFFLWAVVWISSPRVLGEAKAPPPPAEYRVKLRYRISSPRDQHIILYDEMVKYLKKSGFKYKPGPTTDREDPDKNYLEGTIASARARWLLGNAHVQSVLLMPAKYTLPEKAGALVKVHLDLASGLSSDRQRVLFNQTADLLRDLGFQNDIAYDHHGYTRLVGRIPAEQVDGLLKDLRTQPTGWLAPAIPRKYLPLPIRNIYPVRQIEVIAEPAGVKPAATLPKAQPAQAHLEKISRDLRDLVGQEGLTKPVRLEVILARTPGPSDHSWRRQLDNAAPSFIMEGRLGPLVTFRALASEVPDIAKLGTVAVVRLPRPARPDLIPVKGSPADNSKALRATGIYKIGIPRKGVRVGVIDGDFRGWETLVKSKQLPPLYEEVIRSRDPQIRRGPYTRHIDLTAERNRELLPEAFAGDPAELGHGTRCALALARAMEGSGVNFILIRVDPASPYQLQEVARYIGGLTYRSESIAQRADELDYDNYHFRQRRADLVLERRFVLDNFGDQPEDIARRRAYFKNLKEMEADERALRTRELRFLKQARDLRDLKGLDIVSSSLVWHDGYPVDGSSPLSRYFDTRPFRTALWFQSAGNTRGQAWTGLFRDDDGNGVMEFAAPHTPLRPGRWTRELNFLAWQPFRKPQVLDLPAKARLKVSIQWREPHDPEFLRRGEDLYRLPLARLRLLLMRQRDPSGAGLASDEMEVVAGTPGYKERYGLPQRLTNEPTSATYEQTLEFTIPVAGRYALRVEGKVPRGIRPPGEATLAALEKTWELRPRIFVEFADDAARAQGRPVFLDYTTDEGSMGMPADSRGVLTIGAADRSKKPQSYSAPGPAMNLALLAKPDLLITEDGRWGPEGAVAYGTSLATSAAAGRAARALSRGATSAQLWRAWQGRPKRVLVVP